MLQTLWEQLLGTSALEWLGSITGAAGVWLSIREKVWAWPAFVVCYGIYVELSRAADLHAAVLMNLVFVGLSLWGWRQWAQSAAAKDDAEVSPEEPFRPTHASRPALALALAIWLGGSALLGITLDLATEGALPYLDATATVAGFVAQWLLAKKHIETWWLWLVSDVTYIGLFGVQGYVVTALLFGVYTGLAIQGIWQWRRLIAAATPNTIEST